MRIGTLQGTISSSRDSSTNADIYSKILGMVYLGKTMPGDAEHLSPAGHQVGQ